MEQYFNKTGLLWRHYYGPAGPRPPPVLHMWPATEVRAAYQQAGDRQWALTAT